MTTVPFATVIIAVYNHFHWLELILDALRMQTEKNFEVIIADDGSNEETVGKIKQYIALHPELNIIHSWQEDKGWRKNRSLNNAVRKAKSEYLIFVDGDCIPHPRFVKDHLRLRKSRRIVGGRRVDMSPGLSALVESWPSLPADYFSRARSYILRNFFKPGDSMRQLRRTIPFPFIAGTPVGTNEGGFLGCNMGMYKKDLEELNGFDERYVHPGTGEDTDLEARVRNAGMECLRAPHHALMLHRCHPRLPLDSPENKALLKENMDNKVTFVKNGLFQ